jgi:prepilin signal peptidase PulO-like enzyme (type II secretory pathway)
LKIMALFDFFAGLFFMGANTLQDIRQRTICVPLSLAYGLYAAARHLLRGGLPLLPLLFSLLPGAGLCLLALLRKGAVGTGDGIVLMALGCRYGAGGALSLFFYGTVLAAGWGLAGLLRRRCTAGDSLPFMPFLSAAWLLQAAGAAAGL